MANSEYWRMSPDERYSMIVTTTQWIQGKRIIEYKGLVFGEAAFGAGVGTDIGASIASLFGSRSSGYEDKLFEVRMAAIEAMTKRAKSMQANAVIGVDVDYEQFSELLMISVSGTAVVIK